MKIIFWVAYFITVAEFSASSVNVLRGSSMHLQRFRDVNFPLKLAKGLAWLEILALAAVITGLWARPMRVIGGIFLALAFCTLLPWAIRAKRPLGDILGLIFFILCALVVAAY